MAIDDFGVWPCLARSQSLDSVVSSIVWGASAAEAKPDADLLDAIDDVPDGGAVLDLGCGIGRNLVWLARQRPGVEFVGYDAAEMTARVDEYSRAVYGRATPENAVVVSAPDWENVQLGEWDAVIASLVFQHLQPADIAAYIDSLKGIARTLVVNGRRANDHSQKTTWEILEDCGLYPDNAADIDYSPRGDSEEHNLCIYRIK